MAISMKAQTENGEELHFDVEHFLRHNEVHNKIRNSPGTVNENRLNSRSGTAFARTFYVSGFYQRLLHRQRYRDGGDGGPVLGGGGGGSGSLHLARLLLPK